MKLIIPKEVEERIHGYAMSVDSEIAGMGKVRVEGENILVDEVMIYEQEVTGATADLSPKSIAKWQSELVKAGGSPKHWRLWWHSHDNMSAFFSGRDVATIDGQTEGDWLISLVVNKKREREARLDLYRPFRMYMDKLEIQIGIEAETAYTVPADIAREVAEKVKRPVPLYTGMGYGIPRGGSAIELHRYCPMTTMGAKECYKPYGESAGVWANCTSKAFKKKYGANPFMPILESTEPDYTREQLIAITKTLQAQIDQYENRGMGDSGECLELGEELAEMYNQLAEVEPNADIAENIRAKARLIENSIYNIQPYD